MGKVNASLADVQTEFVAVAKGDYEMKVFEIDESGNQGDNPVVIIKSKVDEPSSDEFGKPVWDRIYLRTKKGEPNRYSLAQIKKYFQAICGDERANADDLEYEELLNGRFRGVIDNESYEDKKTGQKKQSAKMADILELS